MQQQKSQINKRSSLKARALKNLPIVVTLRWSFENVALSLEIPNNFDIITELGNEDFSRHTYIDLVMPTFDEKTNTVTDSFGRNAFVSFVSYCHSYTYIKTIDVYWSESEEKIEYRFENCNV